MAEGKISQKELISRFLKLLEKNGDFKKAKEIISLAESLYLKKLKRRKIILETARKIKNLKESFTENGDVVEEKINTDLVAGLKITINGERQLDFSLSKKLNDIFK